MESSRSLTTALTTGARDARATRIFLVRHGATAALGHSLTGRGAAVALNTDGLLQAAELGRTFASMPLAAVLSSPLERARATAAAVAAPHGLRVRVLDALNEVDFGEWTGRGFDELAGDARWTAYNASRSSAIVPGGESAGAVQTRALAALQRIAVEYVGRVVVAVTHAEVIRAAVLHAAGASLDSWQDYDVPPASIMEFLIDV